MKSNLPLACCYFLQKQLDTWLFMEKPDVCWVLNECYWKTQQWVFLCVLGAGGANIHGGGICPKNMNMEINLNKFNGIYFLVGVYQIAALES